MNFSRIYFLIYIFPIFFMAQSEMEMAQGEAMQEIAEQLVDDYLNENYLQNEEYLEEYNPVRKGLSLYDEEGFTLSSIELSWEDDLTADINGDGIEDYIFYIEDVSMGVGGNGVLSEYIIVLMENANGGKWIKKTYPLFSYFSHGLFYLKLDKIRNGIFYGTLTQNPKGYGFEISDDEVKSLPLTFKIEDNKLVNLEYAKCPLRELNKDIFSRELDYKIDREDYIDFQYNEARTETLYLKNGSFIVSELHGCQDLVISFDYTDKKETDYYGEASIAKEAFQNLTEKLLKVTRYKTLFKKLNNKLEQIPLSKIETSKYGAHLDDIKLHDNWLANFSLFYDGNRNLTASLSVYKTAGNQLMEEWDQIEGKVNQ